VNLFDPATWHLFTNLWALFETPLEDGVNGTVTALSGYVAGPFRAWVLVYLIGMLLIAAYSPSEDAAMAFFRHLFRAGFVYMIIAYAANFNFYVGGLALHGLPDGIATALAGQGTAGFGPAAFDKIMVQGFSAGVVVFKLIPWLSFKGLALALFVIIYWLIVAVCVGFTFVVYLAAHAAVALMVAGGPLFIAVRMFPETRRFFSGWLSALVSALVVQIFAAILLSVIIRAETKQLNAMAAMAGAITNVAEDNMFGIVLVLLGAALVFGLGAWLAFKLSSIAMTIAGGVYWNAEAVAQRTASAAGSLLPGGDGHAPAPSGGGGGEAQPAPVYSFQRTVGPAP
jgi:type IV secretion system protein VirB6